MVPKAPGIHVRYLGELILEVGGIHKRTQSRKYIHNQGNKIDDIHWHEANMMQDRCSKAKNKVKRNSVAYTQLVENKDVMSYFLL
jgi:hypothetical protein